MVIVACDRCGLHGFKGRHGLLTHYRFCVGTRRPEPEANDEHPNPIDNAAFGGMDVFEGHDDWDAQVRAPTRQSSMRA